MSTSSQLESVLQTFLQTLHAEREERQKTEKETRERQMNLESAIQNMVLGMTTFMTQLGGKESSSTFQSIQNITNTENGDSLEAPSRENSRIVQRNVVFEENSNTPPVHEQRVSHWDLYSFNNVKLSFSGDNPDESLGSFLEGLEEYIQAKNDIPSKEVLRFLPLILRGSALIWFRAHKRSFGSWEEFKKRFKQAFQPYDDEFPIRQEIRCRTQGEQAETIEITKSGDLVGLQFLPIATTKMTDICHSFREESVRDSNLSSDASPSSKIQEWPETQQGQTEDTSSSLIEITKQALDSISNNSKEKRLQCTETMVLDISGTSQNAEIFDKPDQLEYPMDTETVCEPTDNSALPTTLPDSITETSENAEALGKPNQPECPMDTETVSETSDKSALPTTLPVSDTVKNNDDSKANDSDKQCRDKQCYCGCVLFSDSNENVSWQPSDSIVRNEMHRIQTDICESAITLLVFYSASAPVDQEFFS